MRKTVGTVTTTYVYDAAGQLAAEYGGEVPADSGTRYLFTDHLGSTRLTAKGDGTDPKPLDYYLLERNERYPGALIFFDGGVRNGQQEENVKRVRRISPPFCFQTHER